MYVPVINRSESLRLSGSVTLVLKVWEFAFILDLGRATEAGFTVI